jgi:hypothetical protein
LAAIQTNLNSILDRRLTFVRSYDLRKEVGARLEAGMCPEQPCFRMEIRELELQRDPPSLRLSLGGAWGGNQWKPWRGVGLFVPIKQGCHFDLKTRDFDMKFEIQEDRVSFLRAWVAILKGSLSEDGAVMSTPECPT